jgi:hypothetical protein
MLFKDFFYLSESSEMEWGYFGELTPYLGQGVSERLNWGSAESLKAEPFLYVPIRRGESAISNALTSIRNNLSKKGFECSKQSSAFNGYSCAVAKRFHKTDIKWTGESHLTIALWNDLKGILGEQDPVEFFKSKTLRDGTPLFDENGVGVSMPIAVSSPPELVYGISKAFAGSPIVALLKVTCPTALEVRESLGLPPLKSGYTFHITVGYAWGKLMGDKITTNPSEEGEFAGSASQKHNQTYLQKFG